MSGDFETNEDYMPFLHSLEGKENTITGDLLVSTFGGGTATTEFEVLTGDTAAFLPYGSSPYQMYVKRETRGWYPASRRRAIKRCRCIRTVRPRGTGSRCNERFGFGTQLYEDDFGEDDTERLRSYVR